MTEKIVFIHTPKTCKECIYYDKQNKCCKRRVCRYFARRGRA